MPYSPFHRQTPEYQKKLEERELVKLYGPDYPDVKWVCEALNRMEARLPDGDFTDRDYADLKKARAILDRVNAKANFDPNQPRVPAGNPEGGEWTDAGGGSGGNPSKWYIWGRTEFSHAVLHASLLYKATIAGQPPSPPAL